MTKTMLALGALLTLAPACSSSSPPTTRSGGTTAHGGAGGGTANGGTTSSGGASVAGGAFGAGGTSRSGGMTATGGAAGGAGGTTSGRGTGGSAGTRDASADGSAAASDGATSSTDGNAGGASDTLGGRNGGTGGTGATGGSSGTGGTTSTLPEPTRTVIAGPILNIDFDQSGRPTTEVTEIGYTAWPITAATSATLTVQGITLTVAKAGSTGTGIKSDWQKLAVDGPNYARLVGDGVTVDGGDAGGQIQLTLDGLSAGKHSILVYLNETTTVDSAAPIDIAVDGTTKLSGIKPSIQALDNAKAATAWFDFDAQAGKDVVILFKAQTSSTATSKNVMLNGFDLNVPNRANQATNPTPENGDEHVDCDTGSVTLSWKAASSAASHDVYVCEDRKALDAATRSSPYFKGNQTGSSYKLTGTSSLKTYSWRIDEITSQNVATNGTPWYFRPRHLAFPGAEGYGRFARGGRGGVVVHVTNLDDAGAGSLRDAIETDRGPRVVVFDVAGIIKLGARLSISQSYITVAGQTAPGKGIVIRSAPFGATGARDLVIRNVRVRLGGGATFDGMGLQGSDHAIVDHCSISWTIDEAFSSRSGKSITLQRTMISECLNVAGHANYPAGTEHGYAGSISGDIGSFHHNLLAHCEGRNWSLAGGLDGAGYFAGRLDIFDTVVYNWGGRTTDGGAHQVNFVNNYYKPGGATEVFYALNAQYDSFPGTQQYYFAGNVMPGHFDVGSQDKGRRITAGAPDGYSAWVDKPFFPSYATVQTAVEAYKDVLSDVGMTEPVLDAHDARIIRETLAGTTTYKGSKSGKPGLPDDEADVGGYESYPTETRAANWDSDGDGLPDWWEKQIATNASSAKGDFSDGNADPDGDGYTNLDDYLTWMAKPHYFTSPGASVAIDLAKVFAGYTSSPSYTSSDVANGSLVISGKTATFKASTCGRASWKVSVEDGDGSSKTVEMVAFADAASGSACP